MNTSIKEAIGSIRVSTGKQDASGQARRIEQWCAENGYTLIATYGKAREGESGRKAIEHRETGAAIKHVIARQRELNGGDGICVLVVDCQDRISRVVPDLYAAARLILDSNSDVVFLDSRYTLREQWEDPYQEAFFGMKAVWAQLERRLTGLRTKKTLRDTWEQGFRRGQIPYGWAEDPDQPCEFRRQDGQTKTRYKLVQVPDEQAVIERIKQRREAGVSLAGIANELNKDNIPAKQGGKWHKGAIDAIVNPESHKPKKQRR